MNNKTKLILQKLCEKGRVFYYGSTAILNYNGRSIKIYNILTDLNIAAIGQITSDLKFSSSLGIDAYSIVENELIINFVIFDFDSELNDFDYLKKVSYIKNNNPLFNFFYSPKTGRYYYIEEKYFDDLKKNEINHINSLNLKIEDIIDLSILSGETTCGINVDDNTVFSVDNYFDLKSFVYLIEKALTCREPYYALMVLKKFGLLEYFFPFLNDLKDVTQDRCLHPEGDVYEHTLHCFKYLKNPSLRLSIGMLLHDYGKSLENYNKGYKEHSFLGAKKVGELLRPLGFNNKFIKDVSFLVEYHMINSYFFRLKDNYKNEFFNNELGLDLLRLFKADTLGSIGKLDVYYDIISNLKKDIFRKTNDPFRMSGEYWIN